MDDLPPEHLSTHQKPHSHLPTHTNDIYDEHRHESNPLQSQAHCGIHRLASCPLTTSGRDAAPDGLDARTARVREEHVGGGVDGSGRGGVWAEDRGGFIGW